MVTGGNKAEAGEAGGAAKSGKSVYFQGYQLQ